MKKILILLTFSFVTIVSCKKNPPVVSVPFSPSFPVVTITTDTFFSQPVGSGLPVVAATAYDTFYKQKLTPVIDYSGVQTDTPGFYTISVSAKNKNGYIGYAYAYVAVISTSYYSSLVDLSGRYKRISNSDTVYVTKKVKGIYFIDNVAGALVSDSAKYITPAFFVQLSDNLVGVNTPILLPSQLTTQGILSGINGALHLAPADTTFQYQIINNSFGNEIRVFKKF